MEWVGLWTLKTVQKNCRHFNLAGCRNQNAVRLEKISLLTDDEGRESRENHQMSSLIVGEKPNIQFCV